MCTINTWPEISVGLSVEEARRIADLSIDIPDIEITIFRRKVRDALREYDEALRWAFEQGEQPLP